VSNNGNLFNENSEKIRERIESLKYFVETADVEIIKNQYLAHAEYWERVLQNVQH